MKKFYAFSILATFFFSANVFAQINFNTNPQSGCYPLVVTFTNTTTEPGAYQFRWYFDDGSPVFVDTLTTSFTYTYTVAGNRNPWVDVYDNMGNWLGWAYGSGNINVQGASNFYLMNDSVCPNDMIYFNADPGMSWNWNFGDGNTSTQQYATHSYSATGTYTVTLNMNDQCGNHVFTQTITAVNNLFPNAWINFYPNKVCPGESIGFNPSYSGYSAYFWDFGDGNTSTQPTNLSHSYTATGTYTVVLVVTNGCGNTDTAYVTDTVANGLGFPGGVNIFNNYGDVCPTQQANLYATGDTYPKYVWDFGDGSPLDSSGRNLYHAYATTGTKTVTCTITNYCNIDSVFTTTVNVVNYVPFPNWYNLQVNTSPACPNSDINFGAPGNFNDNYFYTWNYGDGSPMDSAFNLNGVNHTYGPVGTYTASVKIRSACGNDTTLYGIVDINNNAPFPNYPINVDINPNPACPGDNVNINVNQPYNNYSYDFGDGSPVYNSQYNGTNHIYATTGNFTVAITITNNCGNDTTVYGIANISNNAGFGNLSFNVSPDTACPNQSIQFYASQGYASYVWNFGDGSPVDTSAFDNIFHPYSNIGTYTASVTIINNCGQDTTLYRIVNINNSVGFPNNLSIYVNPDTACPGENISLQLNGYYPDIVWNFGDGNIDSTGNFYVYHTYSTTGTYTVSALVTNFCGIQTTVTNTVSVLPNLSFPPNSSLNINDNPACPGQQIGMSAPYGNMAYEWNYGDGSPVDSNSYSSTQHTYTATGTYTVSVLVTNFCGVDTTLTATVTIGNNVGFTPQQLWINSWPSPSCPGDEMFFYAQSGMLSYVWNFGDGDTLIGADDANHIYAAVGNYTVALTLTNHCGIDTTIYEPVSIINNAQINNFFNVNASPQISCPGDMINFHFDGNGFASYLWVFGNGDTAISYDNEVLYAYDTTGFYNVSVTVTNGCGNSATFFTNAYIINNAPVSSNLSLMPIPNPACPGDLINFLIGSGQNTYTYFWNFGDGNLDTTIGSGANHIYSAIGNYTVTLTALNGCGMTKTVTTVMNITNSAVPVLSHVDDGNWGVPSGEGGGPVGCPGDVILFYIMGTVPNNFFDFGDGNTGVATEYMLLQGGDGAFPITIIKHAYALAGTYEVKLTVTNGCGNSATDSMNITIGTNLLVNGGLYASAPPSGSGYNTCTPIDFLGIGGSTYNFNFGDGDTLATVSPTVTHTYSSPGNYVVTVLITNGCGNSASYSLPISVVNSGGPSVSVTSNTSPTCVGGSDGSASVSATSGAPPYMYMWNDASTQSTQIATGLSAGSYLATVTDDIGCASTVTVTVVNPAPIVLSSFATQATCGMQDATAAISITSGGTGPYSYSWSTGATTATATGLGWGPYTVVVTDANGCTSSANISVSENGSATLSIASVTNATCYGGSNGSINMNVTGGNPPYTYAWSNGSTLQDPVGLIAGNYSVMVTDGGGCKAALNTTVGQGTQILVSAYAVISPTCGNFDGTASANVTGGNPPYSYSWSNSGNQTTQTATGLGAGTRTVTVTDANGCVSTGVISLSNSNAPLIAASVTNITCNGAANGMIDLNVTGGTSPFLYTWSSNVGPPQINNEDVNLLPPGNYIVTVQDASGCFSFSNYTITQPSVLTTSVTNTGATCNTNDGTATASPGGGTSPYMYSWTGGQTTQTAIGLALGNYTVTVTDNNGCTAVSTTTITATTNLQEICMVTVDSTSTKNVIVWEKPIVTNIDSFRIYRDIASVYTYVGGVDYAALSTFTDSTTGVNPNFTSYRYKMTMLDDCGAESAMSSFHKTIHLQVGAALPSGYDLNWDDYLGFTVAQYRILRDTNNLGNWVPMDSVPFGITSYTDPIQWDSVGYIIEIDHPVGCNISFKNPIPMATNLNSSRSNIYKVADSTVVSVNNITNGFIANVYPNPSSGIFTLDLRNNISGSAIIKVYNVLGDEVKKINCSGCRNKITIDLSIQSKGVYYLQISTSDNVTTKKIIIE